MSRTALIIDNDESTVSQVNSALSSLGYTVSSASDATAGLDMANNLVPNIMLVNLATPGSNGLELCKTIHGTDGLKEVPIILLTLREGKFDPVYVKLYGIVAFLKKPFDGDTLIALVNENSTAADEQPAEAYAEPSVVAYEEPAEVEAVAEAIEEPVEAEPAVEAFGGTEYAEPAAEVYEEPSMAEPVMETFDQASYGEADATSDFTSGADSYGEADATTAFSVDDASGEAFSFEPAGEGDDYDDTVTLSETESDLGELQASFSDDQYAGDETAVMEESSGFEVESFGMDTSSDIDAAGDGGGWGDMSAGMRMDEGGSDDHADETWGGMGGDLSMSDAFGESAGGDKNVSADAFAAAEEPGGFDAGGGFDSEGTMAFDAGGEPEAGMQESAGGFDAGGGFDSEGTMAFDSPQTDSFDSGGSENLDIGGFQASKEAAPAGGEAFALDDTASEGAWGESAVKSAPAPEQPVDAFDDAEEAFSSGFEDDEDEVQEESGLDDFSETSGFEGEDVSFDTEDAGFESDFLDEQEESSSDFAGDDQDYTGLFEPLEEESEEPEEDQKKKKKEKKKKKKGFKKGTPSKARRVLVLLLLLIVAGGGAFFYRDKLPFDITNIKLPDIKLPDLSDIKIPFIGGDKSEGKKQAATPKPRPETPEPARKPEPAKPEPQKPEPERVEPSKPVADTAGKPAAKAPAKKEPVAPKPEVSKKKPAEEQPARKAQTAQVSSTGEYKKGYYYVQFGVFSNSKNADILSGQLNRKGYPTIKRTITSKGKKLTLVLLDKPYKQHSSAEKKGKTITDKTGFDTAVYH